MKQFLQKMKNVWRDLWERHPGKLYAVLAVLLLLYPVIIPDQYWLRVATNMGLYVILALGINIVVGYCGLLDLGFVAFYGIGAYTAALLTTSMQISFWMAVPISMVLGGSIATILGTPVLKLRGDYLAIVTVGFCEIIRLTFMNWVSLTRGPMGIPNIPAPTVPFLGWSFQLSSRYYAYHPFYYLMLVFVALTIVTIHRLEFSRIGRAWKAIREDELAAQAMGIPVLRYKTLAYATGAMYGAMGGSFMACFNQFVAPGSFTFLESCMILCMVVIGGLGTMQGAILGALLLGSVPELLRQLPDLLPAVQSVDFVKIRDLLFGLLMVIVVVLRPQGLAGRKTK